MKPNRALKCTKSAVKVTRTPGIGRRQLGLTSNEEDIEFSSLCIASGATYHLYPSFACNVVISKGDN